MHQTAGSIYIKNPMFDLQSAPNKSNYEYINFFFFSTFQFFLFFLFKIKRKFKFFLLTFCQLLFHQRTLGGFFPIFHCPHWTCKTIVVCQYFGRFLKNQHLYVYLDRRSNHTSILY